MAVGRARWARSGREQRGVALLEMAIVTPLLLLVVFGIIEFGSAYNDKITLNQGVREAARIAANGTIPACGGATTSTDKIICLTRERIGGDLGAAAEIGVDAPATPQPGLPVTVCAEITLDSITPIVGQFIDGKTLHSKTTMRIEQEADPPVGDGGTITC